MAGTTWRDPPRAMAEQLDTDKRNDLPPEPAKGLLHSSALVGGATLVSRVLGLVRDVVLANLVGATSNSDAFFVAFKINRKSQVLNPSPLTDSRMPSSP